MHIQLSLSFHFYLVYLLLNTIAATEMTRKSRRVFFETQQLVSTILAIILDDGDLRCVTSIMFIEII